MLNAIWPRAGLRRTLRYRMHRLARIKGTPHGIAAGLACGVAASITPLIGLQIPLAALLALLCRGSVVASFAGTFFANPWTMPLIWLGTLRLGSWMLFGDTDATNGAGSLSGVVGAAWAAIRAHDMDLLQQGIWPVLLAMSAGSVPVAIIAWCATYWPTRELVRRRARRRGLLPI